MEVVFQVDEGSDHWIWMKDASRKFSVWSAYLLLQRTQVVEPLDGPLEHIFKQIWS